MTKPFLSFLIGHQHLILKNTAADLVQLLEVLLVRVFPWKLAHFCFDLEIEVIQLVNQITLKHLEFDLVDGARSDSRTVLHGLELNQIAECGPEFALRYLPHLFRIKMILLLPEFIWVGPFVYEKELVVARFIDQKVSVNLIDIIGDPRYHLVKELQVLPILVE